MVWNLVAFYHCITDNIPFPEFTYTYEFNSVSRVGSITVTTVDAPVSTRVRWTNTTDLVAPRRDFRQRILNGSSVIDNPATWYEDIALDLGEGVLLARYPYPPPGAGYMAFYIELEYLTQNLETIILTTEAITIPPTFPYPGCQFEECTGTLV
ncbi:unnamed protein product [Owenia fusiformis]|uniref:Uncharacterized protein n=1 Tax=Owenia fusiformis TaxID=6347 RepID=A0A8S4NS62_OWEFU|nr:unnamed protein product [Owenia fusiformis]